MYHYTCHDNSYIFYYKSYGPSWIFCKHNVLMSLKFLFDVERWLLVAYHCVIHHWKAVQKHYNLQWKLVGGFSFLRTLWLENWKYCWILASNVFSMMNTDYFPFLHGRVSKCLHFIFWSQFWNINHERIMDTFCHFSSLTWPIYFGFLLILYQTSSFNRSIIEHVEQVPTFTIAKVVVYRDPLISIMHSYYQNFEQTPIHDYWSDCHV